MAANDSYTVNRRAKRQHMVLVLERDDAFLGYALRHSIPMLHIRNLHLNRVVKEPHCKDGAQNAVYVIVQLILRDFSALHGLLQRLAEKELVRLLLVQSCVRGLHRRVCPAPIRKHKALEPKGFLQNIGQQVAVFAGKVAIYPVIRAHHSLRIADAQRNLEGAQSVSRIERLSIFAFTALRPLS